MRLLAVFLLCLVVLTGIPSWGQEEEPVAPVIILDSEQPTPPFSRPVDPDLYIIRPGDELRITYVKSQLEPMNFTVNPEGRIVDRTLGAHDLSFKTLTQAREILGNALRDLYNIPGITIDVTRSRYVSIVVTGAVHAPGTYDVYTSQKVSDVIDLAGGVTSEGSRRWILFTGGPNPVKVDLDRAIFLGDPVADPGVYAGRTIYVPNKFAQTVHVAGEVIIPREIELVPGDDLATLIALAGGLRRNGDSTAIQIVSRTGQGSRDNIQGGDIIIVPAKKPAGQDIFVSVFGAVANQGVINFHTGLTLGEALKGAGGLSSDANLDLVTVFRRPRMDSKGRFTYERYPISEPLGGGDKSLSFKLEPEDSLFVPVKVGFVRVGGEVVNPGYFAFEQGKDILYYVKTAGGFLSTADKEEIFLLNPVSMVTSVCTPGVMVHDGSIITVAVREEIK